MICVVVTGNVGDGFQFYGPFEDMQMAGYFAEADLKNEPWTVMALKLPPHQYLPYGDLREQKTPAPYNQEVDIETS